MLEMRPACERCSTPLPADGSAFICSFECTFCPACTMAMGRCPNCGGELLPRPRRRPKSDSPAIAVATPGTPLHAREASARDAEAIAAIYNEGIAERTATFETRPRSPQDILRWLIGRHPVVVVEDGPAVVAFASTSAYRPRACYDHIAEFSVYVGRPQRGRGAGRLALTTLFAKARAAGLGKLVSRVFSDNAASRSLLCKLGFREVGVYEKHGQIAGIWRDVVIVEKFL
jgi:L-amino acid N-acyltransferase YncA